jgi:hypothetical protein
MHMCITFQVVAGPTEGDIRVCLRDRAAVRRVVPL